MFLFTLPLSFYSHLVVRAPISAARRSLQVCCITTSPTFRFNTSKYFLALSLLLFDGNITGTVCISEVKYTNILQESIDAFLIFLRAVHWHLRCLPPSASCLYVLASACFSSAALTSSWGGKKQGRFMVKRQKNPSDRERKAVSRRRRRMESFVGGFENKTSGRKTDCLTHGLTPLCFVRESALCCPETLSESPNSVNHC